MPAGGDTPDIAFESHGLASFALDRRNGLACIFVLGKVLHDDIRGFASEQHRHGTTDAGICARDQRYFVIEFPGPW